MGINKGSVQVDLFQEWCEKNNVKCQVELYESSEQRYADMNSGKLDAIVSTTVAEKEISKYLWNSIVKIGYSPYYFAVSKKVRNYMMRWKLLFCREKLIRFFLFTAVTGSRKIMQIRK